jgi:uncharacterized protein YdiU (UPF0061 family)
MRASSTLAALAARADHSWLDTLEVEKEAAAHAPNKTSRQVKQGHFVPVKPTPLPDPRYVMHNPTMAAVLGLSDDECASSSEFARFFSGDVAAVPSFRSWCTPYALSIYGQPMTDNCPFKNGNGYGDGRAISVGEVSLPPPVPPTPADGSSSSSSSGGGGGGGPPGSPAYSRLEFQLKGAGTTPFCRGGDGRAVLRSRVREDLAL